MYHSDIFAEYVYWCLNFFFSVLWCGGLLGQLGIEGGAAVTTDVLALIDFYVDNGIIEKDGEREVYPVTVKQLGIDQKVRSWLSLLDKKRYSLAEHKLPQSLYLRFVYILSKTGVMFDKTCVGCCNFICFFVVGDVNCLSPPAIDVGGSVPELCGEWLRRGGGAA